MLSYFTMDGVNNNWKKIFGCAIYTIEDVAIII